MFNLIGNPEYNFSHNEIHIYVACFVAAIIYDFWNLTSGLFSFLSPVLNPLVTNGLSFPCLSNGRVHVHFFYLFFGGGGGALGVIFLIFLSIFR